ncbi:effector-associated domain 2-containing protein [Amycolatopsis magusensis]|uniref:effector-associated domain 2-containing protein n=1 Tax=Amycolatopsis magusensis TaxID=882444 RepID=UPI0037A70440
MAEHRSIVVVDVARFTDPARRFEHHQAVHEGLYHLLITAADESGIDWKACHVEDRGDGAFVLVPPEFPKLWLADQWPSRLLAGLRRHNSVHAREAHIHLRMSLHAGEIHSDANGVVSPALNLAFRLVDAPPAKTALDDSGGLLAVVASDSFYTEVIAGEPAANPAAYQRIDVAVKQTRATAWLRLPEGMPPAPVVPAPDFFSLIDELLRFPVLREPESRQLLLDLLPAEIAHSVPHHPRPRLHVIALVRTCLRHENGLTTLLTALRTLDGDSPPLRRLESIARNGLSDYRP